METRSGKVVNTLSETITKPGKRPFSVHRVVLATGDEVEVGFKQPYHIGDMFNSEVEFKYGKYKEVRALGSAPVTSGGGGVMAAAAAAPGMAFPIPKASKETAIIRQNALTNAVNLYTSHLETQGAAGIGDWDKAVEHILGLAYKFAEFSSGQREIRLAKELVGDGND